MKEPLEIVVVCASPQETPQIAGLIYEIPRSRPDITVRCLPPTHLANLVSNITNFKPTIVVVSTRNVPHNEATLNMLKQMTAARVHVILTPAWPGIAFPYFHVGSSKQQVRSLIDKLLDGSMKTSETNSNSGQATQTKLQRQLIINIVRSSDKGFNDQMSNLRFRYNNLQGLAFRQVNFPNQVRPMPHQQHILIIFKDEAKTMRIELQNIGEQYPIFKILFKNMVPQAALNEYFHMATSNLQSVEAQVDKFLAMQSPSSQYTIMDKMHSTRLMQPTVRSMSAPQQQEEGLRNSKVIYVNQNGEAVNREVDVGNRGNIDPRFANPALLQKMGVKQASGVGSSIKSYNQYYNLNNPQAMSPQLSLTGARPLSSMTARSASSSTYRIRLESARRVSQKNSVKTNLQPRLYIVESEQQYFKQLSTALQTMCRPTLIKELREKQDLQNGAIMLVSYEMRRNLAAYLLNKKPKITCILFGEELFPDQILNNQQIALVTQNPQHVVQYLRMKGINMTEPIVSPNLVVSPPIPSLKLIDQNKVQKPKSVRFIQEQQKKAPAITKSEIKPLIQPSSSRTIISELGYTNQWTVRKRPGANVFVTYPQTENQQQYLRGPMPGIRSTNKMQTKIINEPRVSIKNGRPYSGMNSANENAAKARQDYFERIHTEPDPRLLANKGTKLVEDRFLAETTPRIDHQIVNPPSNQGSTSQTNSLKINSNQSFAADRLVAGFALQQMTIPVSPVAPFSRAGPVIPTQKQSEKPLSRRKIINLAETSFSNYSHLNINSMKTSNITARQVHSHSQDGNPFTLTKANKPNRIIQEQTSPHRQDATNENISGLSQPSDFPSATSSSSSSSKTENKQIDKKKTKLRTSNSSQENASVSVSELGNSLEKVDEEGEDFKKQAGESDAEPRKRPSRKEADSKTKISRILEQAAAIKAPPPPTQQKFVINYKIPAGGNNITTLTPEYEKVCEVKPQEKDQKEERIIIPQIPYLRAPPRLTGNGLLSPTNYVISEEPNEGGSLIDRESRVQPQSARSFKGMVGQPSQPPQPSLTKEPSWYDARLYDKRLQNGQYIYIRKTSSIAAQVLEEPISDKAASFSRHSNSVRQNAHSSIHQQEHSNKISYNAMADMTNNHLDHRVQNGISIYSRKSYKSPIRIEENSNPTQYNGSMYQMRVDQIRQDLQASQSQIARTRREEGEHMKVATKSSVELPRSKDEVSPLANHFKSASSSRSDILYLVPTENVNLKNKLSLFVQKPQIHSYNSVEELAEINYNQYAYALIFPRENQRVIKAPAANAFFIHMLKPVQESPTNQLFINDLWQLSNLATSLGRENQEIDKSSTGTLLRNHGVRLQDLLRICNDRSKLLYSSNQPELQDILTRRLINKVIPIKFHDAEELMDRVRQYSKDSLVVLMDSSMMPYISEIKSTARLTQIIVLDRFNRSTISRDMDVRIVNSFQQALRAVEKIA